MVHVGLSLGELHLVHAFAGAPLEERASRHLVFLLDGISLEKLLGSAHDFVGKALHLVLLLDGIGLGRLQRS